ncbi:MAG TPA: hypothetical protein VFL76_03355 [Edaphocola sp.]|nr:hypothetical protein [Edaphocola sp.]
MHITLSVKRFAGLALTAFLWSAIPAVAQVNSFLQSYSRFEKRRAEGKSVKSYLSYGISLGMAFSSVDFSHSYATIDGSGNIVGSNTISRGFDVHGFQFGADVYFHLFDVTPNSSVVFNVNPTGYIFHYEMGPVKTSNSNLSEYDYTLGIGDLAVPLTLDYKTGGEALFDKSYRTSFTLGAGLSPVLYGTNFGDLRGMKFGIRPFVHAEIGIFAAIEWKIRLSYMPGAAKVMDVYSDDAGMESMPVDSHIQMSTSSMFSVGIALMPFSFGWKSERW